MGIKLAEQSKECVGCGGSLAGRSGKKYCSSKCYHSNHLLWNKGNCAKKTYTCPHCKVSFKAYHEAIYCSIKCRDAARPVWNKGLTAKKDSRIAKYAKTQTGKPKHTEESKRKIGDSKRGIPFPHTKEWDRKIGEGGKRYHAEHPEYVKEKSKRMSGKNHPLYGVKSSIETRQKQSSSHALRFQKNPQCVNTTYKTGYYHSDKNNQDFWYRSSYEKKAFELLEKSKDVTKYEVESLRIPYEYDGFTHYFVPDILVKYQNSSKRLIEVKPKNRVHEKQNQAKFTGAIKYCEDNDMTFVVWTEKELEIIS